MKYVVPVLVILAWTTSVHAQAPVNGQQARMEQRLRSLERSNAEMKRQADYAKFDANRKAQVERDAKQRLLKEQSKADVQRRLNPPKREAFYRLPSGAVVPESLIPIGQRSKSRYLGTGISPGIR